MDPDRLDDDPIQAPPWPGDAPRPREPGADASPWPPMDPLLAALPPIGVGSPHQSAIEALLAAGFSLAAKSARADPSGAIRDRALLLHPLGLIVEASSGLPREDGERMVEALTLRCAIDFGHGAARSRGICYGMRASRWMRDATVRVDLRAAAGHGNPSLLSILADAHADARLVPFSEWPATCEPVDSNIYSERQAFLERAASEALAERELHDLDFDAFAASLPPDARPIFTGGDREGFAALQEATHSAPSCSMLAELASSAGREAPSPTEAKLARGWSLAIDDFADKGRELPDLLPGERLHGANLLHALAATPFDPAKEPLLGAWLDRQDPQALREASEAADSFGRIPAAIACAGELDGSARSPATHAMAKLLIERGMAGGPGQLGSACFAHLERGGIHRERGSSESMAAAELFSMAERLLAPRGTDWLAPLATAGEPIHDRSQALGLLLRRLPAPSPSQLHRFESMVLSIAAAPPAPCSAKAARL